MVYRAFILWGVIMYSNADITLYSYVGGLYIRKVIKKVFWDECQQSNINKSGLVNADKVAIYIPYSSSGALSFTTSKDIIVKGVSTYEIVSTSQQTISTSLKYLKDNFQMLTISVADLKDFGNKNMWHYELSCK